MRNKTAVILLALIMSAGTMALSACSDDGPAENAGEQIDNAADDVADAIEDSTD